MTKKWTPEPWYIQPDPWPPSIRAGKEGEEIAYAQSPYTNPEYRTLERANGDRIVACVNACVGMSDPAAEIKAMREANRAMGDALAEIHAWLVCASITTAEDMAQNFSHMTDVAGKALRTLTESEERNAKET